VVNETAPANELGLGRTPVREVIARPGTDRFSTDFPLRGADVTPVRRESAFEKY
jgi:DNA-binding GntR family transcriptional regulator